MQTVVDKLLTRYDRKGKGKSIVLLHGWANQASGMAELGKKLAEHYDVIMIDLPGFGGTEMPTEAWGLNDYATFIAHFLRKLDIPSVFAYIGHSNGGAIAIRGLSNGELKADKLILLSSAGIRNIRSKRSAVIKTVTKTGKLLVRPLPKTLQLKIRQKLYNTVGSDMLITEHMSETFKKIITEDIQPDAKQLNLQHFYYMVKMII